MKKTIFAGVAIMVLIAMPVFAHHAAEGIVDEEIYEMIDSMVADTPHADLVFDDMGGGMTEISITTRTTQEMENLLEDGLLTYLGMLDGDVSLTIDFEVRRVEMTVIQQE